MEGNREGAAQKKGRKEQGSSYCYTQPCKAVAMGTERIAPRLQRLVMCDPHVVGFRTECIRQHGQKNRV